MACQSQLGQTSRLRQKRQFHDDDDDDDHDDHDDDDNNHEVEDYNKFLNNSTLPHTS